MTSPESSYRDCAVLISISWYSVLESLFAIFLPLHKNQKMIIAKAASFLSNPDDWQPTSYLLTQLLDYEQAYKANLAQGLVNQDLKERLAAERLFLEKIESDYKPELEKLSALRSKLVEFINVLGSIEAALIACGQASQTEIEFLQKYQELIAILQLIDPSCQLDNKQIVKKFEEYLYDNGSFLTFEIWQNFRIMQLVLSLTI